MTISSENSNQSVVRLAVKCMLISSQQEESILATLKDRVEQDPTYSVIDFFKEGNTFSQKKIDFLLAFKKYLDTQELDIEFGQLAIANDFATREAINDALDFQKDCYSRTEQTKEISESLLKKEQITLGNCTAILIVQDRIKDDMLAQALDDLGSSQAEKKAINKRFGVIALKRELISLDQLNEALTAQQGELLLGEKRRHLHEILEESSGLSTDDTISILKEQKQFEKRRLNLEKALATYNTEIRLSNKLGELFKYRVPKTGLEAYVSKIKDLPEEIKWYDFFSWLKQIGIKFGIVDDKTIEDFLFNKKAEEEIVIAKGYPPVEGEDESIEFLFDTNFVLPDEQVKNEEIPLVKKGDVLAKIIPGKKGKPGKDVWGQSIEPADIKICPVNSWKGVRLDDLVFTADIDGIPLLHNGKAIIVSPLPEESQTHIISENIESETGDTYKAMNLEIKGIIGKEAVLFCHDLILQGDALGNIYATGDIEVKGSIGIIENTGSETVHQTNIFADGDIIVRKNIQNTKLETGKELIAPNSEIISSEIIAVDGIILRSVGFNEANPSVLQIGKKSDPKTLKIDKMIEEKGNKLKELKHQKAHVEEVFNIESGMLKATVEVTKKMNHDHETRASQIEKEIENNSPEIKKIEDEIERLSAGKELLLSKQEASFNPINSVIKVKGQIAKGTIIKGQVAQMVVEETMYGVKLMEVRNSLKNETKILVEGYFS
ncbi:MAG: DUF342 domain-containing protein [Desulfobacterales bacterium]|nr:DUF342 domain-containing protein [Desulfobacterales bacterium]